MGERSFVSIDVSRMPAIQDIQKKLRGIPGISVPRDVHMTLRFLGDVDTGKLKKLSSEMKALEEYSTFNVSMKGLGAFPHNKDPRIVWIGAEMGSPFYDILSDIDEMLDRTSVDYDRKPFKAHVTVGRVKNASKNLADLLNECRSIEVGSFVCPRIYLMSSRLTPDGAKHSVIDTFKLKNNIN
jgi:2'-5' RNA ligase